MQRHPLAALTSLYFFFLLAGCGILGVQAPSTFNEKAAAATTSANAASQTVLTLLTAHKITPDESDKYTARIEDAQKAIDATRVVYVKPNSLSSASKSHCGVAHTSVTGCCSSIEFASIQRCSPRRTRRPSRVTIRLYSHCSQCVTVTKLLRPQMPQSQVFSGASGAFNVS